MREIKFRVWDREMENMVYQGSNTTKNNGWVLAQFIFDELDVGLIGTGYGGETEDIFNFELMQYTGLKDKNGVEIYEGDICRVTGEEWYCNSYFNIDEPWSMNMKVTNEEYAFAFQDLQDKHKEIFLYETNYNEFEIEVIGNIYENKELLEVEKSSEKASVTFKKGNITFNQTGNNNTFIGSVDTLIL